MAASRTLFRTASRLPVLREAAALAYARYFAKARGRLRLFRGIFPDFASSVAAVPAHRDIGYDNEASARRLLDEREAITPSDYPTIFWLDRILPGARSLFDWGGYVGTTYLTYRKYVAYPQGLEWIVNDVPAVVALGLENIAREPLAGLSFTTGFDRLPGADILLAAGSLQFIEDPFATLRSLPTLPRTILVNKTPVYDRAPAVTLQNLGTAIAPYHLFNRAAFLRNFDDLGYDLVDAWANPGLGCEIPFFPSYSIGAFSGFYFRRR